MSDPGTGVFSVDWKSYWTGGHRYEVGGHRYTLRKTPTFYTMKMTHS